MRLRRALDRRTAAVRGALTPSAAAGTLRSRFAQSLVSGELTPLFSKALAEYLTAPTETAAPAEHRTRHVLPLERRSTGGEVAAVEPAAAPGRSAASAATSTTAAAATRPALPDWPREAGERPPFPTAAARPTRSSTQIAVADPLSRSAASSQPPVARVVRTPLGGAHLLTARLASYFAALPLQAQAERVPVEPPRASSPATLATLVETERRISPESWMPAAGPLGARRVLANFMYGLDGRSARSLPDTSAHANEPARFGGMRRLQPAPAIESDLSERLADILREQALRQGIDLT